MNPFGAARNFLGGLLDQFQPKLVSPIPENVQNFSSNIPAPAQNPNAIPGGMDLALNYIRSQTPKSTPVEEYYPAFKDPNFLPKVQAADQQRQGLSNLLLLQAFLESTLGRGSSNIFGTKPRGQVSSFQQPSQAVDYQLSSNVLGGGSGGKLNLLNSNQPLTREDIIALYRAYDPAGAYLNQLLPALGF